MSSGLCLGSTTFQKTLFPEIDERRIERAVTHALLHLLHAQAVVQPDQCGGMRKAVRCDAAPLDLGCHEVMANSTSDGSRVQALSVGAMSMRDKQWIGRSDSGSGIEVGSDLGHNGWIENDLLVLYLVAFSLNSKIPAEKRLLEVFNTCPDDFDLAQTGIEHGVNDGLVAHSDGGRGVDGLEKTIDLALRQDGSRVRAWTPIPFDGPGRVLLEQSDVDEICGEPSEGRQVGRNRHLVQAPGFHEVLLVGLHILDSEEESWAMAGEPSLEFIQRPSIRTDRFRTLALQIRRCKIIESLVEFGGRKF